MNKSEIKPNIIICPNDVVKDPLNLLQDLNITLSYEIARLKTKAKEGHPIDGKQLSYLQKTLTGTYQLEQEIKESDYLQSLPTQTIIQILQERQILSLSSPATDNDSLEAPDKSEEDPKP